MAEITEIDLSGREMKTCPFCGRPPVIHSYDFGSGPDYLQYNPQCSGEATGECYCDMGWYETPEAAMAAWNSRDGMSEQRENHLLRSALANVQIIIEELSSQLHYSTVRQEKRK